MRSEPGQAAELTPAHGIGRGLSDLLGWPEAPWETVGVNPSPTALATWMPIVDMAVAAQGLVGLAAAALHEARTGTAQTVSVDRWEASLSMTPAAYLTIDGERAVEWDPLTGYFQAADGWVYLHTAFPHLRAGLLAEFGLPEDRAAVAAGLASLPAQTIEDRAAAAGVCAIRRRSRGQWDAHPHAAVLRTRPVVDLARHGDAPARSLAPGAAPLEGVRVLDLSRVIAGPTIGRTLAEHGAEVLRIGAAHLPSIAPLLIDTGYGKRSAFIDLRQADGRTTLAALIRDADVLIDGYRPGALARHGFGHEDLRALNPGIVLVTLSAFGADGPWGGRRGYDTYVQAATGLSAETPDGPARLPCQPLDYLTGYFGAAAAMVALRRRMTEDGAWSAELALARTAMWLWQQTDALGAEADPPAVNPSIEEVSRLLVQTPSAFGVLRSLRPAVSLSVTPPRWRSAPVPLGSDPPLWLATGDPVAAN